GTVGLAAGTVTFTPDANYNGPASFTYTMQDAAGAQSTATVNVTLNAVNDAPVIQIPSAVSFAPAVSYAAGNPANFVAIGDFDGDGKADLAVNNLFNNTVSVL